MQVRDSRPVQGFSIIQLLDATASDETRQDKTPFAVRARCKGTVPDGKRRGAERRGVGRSGGTGRGEVQVR